MKDFSSKTASVLRSKSNMMWRGKGLFEIRCLHGGISGCACPGHSVNLSSITMLTWCSREMVLRNNKPINASPLGNSCLDGVNKWELTRLGDTVGNESSPETNAICLEVIRSDCGVILLLLALCKGSLAAGETTIISEAISLVWPSCIIFRGWNCQRK